MKTYRRVTVKLGGRDRAEWIWLRSHMTDLSFVAALVLLKTCCVEGLLHVEFVDIQMVVKLNHVSSSLLDGGSEL
ncbi:hypothetical protein TNCV_635141 [Trichonephila clavipes]|nr:hypothetical protein TNCV_635141 [Trichonephila clavipes]